MSPGLRLFAAPAVLLAGALLCYLLPRHMTRRARLVAMLAIGAAAVLLLSDATLVLPTSRLERNLGQFAPGVQLVARADPAGLVIMLLACGLALFALAERRRQPLERCALLLCLAGTLVAALAGNAVLLFGGLELADVGALLLAAGGVRRLGARARLAFALQHASSLGLLIAAVSLQSFLQTSDLSAIPPASVGGNIAGPWAFAGAVRLLAPAALPGRTGRAGSSAWLPVAAIPCGLIVLLRLVQVTGGELPATVADSLVAGGLVAGIYGVARAARCWRMPALAGRALAVAAAGPVIALAGIGTQAALAGMAAAGLALALGVAAAPAWGGGGDEGSGPGAAWTRAAALAALAGLPIGYGTSAAVLASGAVVAEAYPWAVVAVLLGTVAVLAAGVGALAARAALLARPPHGRLRGPRADALLALGVSALAALLPGLAQTAFVDRVASAATGPLDVGATRVPGGAWAGGYLTLATLLAAATAAAAAMLEGRRLPLPEGGVQGVAEMGAATRLEGSRLPAPRVAPPAQPRTPWVRVSKLVWSRRLAVAVRRSTEGLAAVDGWLTEQPGLALVVAGAVACLFIFR